MGDEIISVDLTEVVLHAIGVINLPRHGKELTSYNVTRRTQSRHFLRRALVVVVAEINDSFHPIKPFKATYSTPEYLSSNSRLVQLRICRKPTTAGEEGPWQGREACAPIARLATQLHRAQAGKLRLSPQEKRVLSFIHRLRIHLIH
jgi:hypothetical protein